MSGSEGLRGGEGMGGEEGRKRGGNNRKEKEQKQEENGKVTTSVLEPKREKKGYLKRVDSQNRVNRYYENG